MGAGRYRWVDVDGTLCQGAHWNDLPGEMDRLVEFVPDYPSPPHTQADHDLMAAFEPKLHEALARCRR